MVMIHSAPTMFQKYANDGSVACLSINSKNAQNAPEQQRRRNNWWTWLFGFRAKTKIPRLNVIAADIRHNKEMAGSEYVTISLSFSPSLPHTWFIN